MSYGRIPLSYQPSEGGEGAEVVYSLKNNSDFAELILDNIGEKGQIKRKVYQRRLPENPSKDYYYILRETNTKEPVLIEYGFIDNPKDSEKLKNNLNDYAEAVVESISEYLGYPYTESKTEEYIVKKGDTLYSISRKFNISVDELKRINNLTSNTLSIGQVLKLQENPFDEIGTHVVQKNETLWSISRLYGVPIQDIIDANKLSSSTLQIGQVLYIPTISDIPQVPESPEYPEYPDDLEENEDNTEIDMDEYMIYTVQKGDSLWLISQKFGITVPELIDLNNLQNLTIQIGQKLLVPKTEETIENYYIVQSGDTLWSIANKNNITVDELKEKNGLTSNLLSVGQQLII